MYYTSFFSAFEENFVQIRLQNMYQGKVAPNQQKSHAYKWSLPAAWGNRKQTIPVFLSSFLLF